MTSSVQEVLSIEKEKIIWYNYKKTIREIYTSLYEIISKEILTMDKTILENAATHIIEEIICSQVAFDADELKDYFKISFEKLSGMSFSSISEELKKTVDAIKKTTETPGKLYRLIDSLNGKEKKNPTENITKWQKSITDRVKNVEVAPSVSKMVVNINPTAMLMAVSLTTINQKLDKMQETQTDILEFLQLKEKATLKGNVAVLQEVFDEYKYNWNNEKYKNNKYIQIQEIKRDAEHSIVLCREQIEKKINKKGFVHSDRDVKSKVQKIRFELKDYELAMYIFSFASFMEVMLLENFNSGYLESVTNKIELYTAQYTELQKKCYEQIEKDSQTSVQSHVLKGVAGFNKVLGKGIAKIPKIRDGQVDETLISAGERVDVFNDKRIENTIELLGEESCTCVRPFIENIIAIDMIYNGEMDILFDNDNVYFKLPTTTK